MRIQDITKKYDFINDYHVFTVKLDNGYDINFNVTGHLMRDYNHVDDSKQKHEEYIKKQIRQKTICIIKDIEKVKTKNDALLYSKDNKKVVREFCKNVLQGKVCLRS
jgi:hypothetical protein